MRRLFFLLLAALLLAVPVCGEGEREALEEALQMPVREAWLYLFRSRKFIPIPSDPKDEV